MHWRDSDTYNTLKISQSEIRTDDEDLINKRTIHSSFTQSQSPPRRHSSMLEHTSVSLADDNHVSMTHSNKVCPTPYMPFPPVVPFIPENLEYIDIGYSKLNLPIYNFTVKDNYSVRRIKARDSMLFCWQGPVAGLHALEYLDLSSNRCKRISQNFFDEFKNLKELDISDNLLGMDIKADDQGNIMKNMKKLQKLDLSMNAIHNIPNRFLWAQVELQVLNLSFNGLTAFNLQIEHMKALHTIDLSENGISALGENERGTIENLAKPTKRTLNLTGNHMHCYCKHISTLKWIRKAESSSLKIILERCQDESEAVIPIRDSSDLDEIISRLERECVINYVVIVIVTLITVIITNILVGVLVYRFRWKLRYWYYVSRHYYRRKRGTYRRYENLASDSDDKKYDVFIICSEVDARSQFVCEMFSYLQNNNDLKVIEQERHFFANQYTTQMICSAIHESRVSIFVVTNQWILEDKWEFPMQMCLAESMNRDHRMYFSVFPEGLPEDIPNSKKWRILYDIANATENLEYPDGHEADNNVDSITTFWRHFMSKVFEFINR